MKYKELIELTTDDLTEKLIELKKEYVDKKIATNNNSLKDTSSLGKIRKDTARIYTIINERKKHG